MAITHLIAPDHQIIQHVTFEKISRRLGVCGGGSLAEERDFTFSMGCKRKDEN